MSIAILRKLPIIVLTCVIFSSISPSRASLLILLKRRNTIQDNYIYNHCRNSSGGEVTFGFEGDVFVLLGNITACWTNSVAIIHNSGRLIIDYFTIVIAFPRSFIFLKLRRPEKRWVKITTENILKFVKVIMLNITEIYCFIKQLALFRNERGGGAYKGTMRNTHLLQGKTHSPQHFSMPARLLSASFISALIWSMPSSMRSSCSVFFF